MSQELTVEAFDELVRLDRIAPWVTTVTIVGPLDAFALPQLPAHVEKLDLQCLKLVGPVHLHEGLKNLDIWSIETETPFAEWIFPSTLEVVFAGLSNEKTKIDLRAVTAPTIVLDQVSSSYNGPPLPEGLRHLVISGTGGLYPFGVAFPRVREGITDPEAYRTEAMKTADRKRDTDGMIRTESFPKTKIYLLPPHLESLKTRKVDYFWTEGELQTETIKEVGIDTAFERIDYAKLFPNVERLTIRSNVRASKHDEIYHPTLTELTLVNAYNRKAKIRAPQIETLTIRDTRVPRRRGRVYIADNYYLLEGRPYEMTLSGLNAFPTMVEEPSRLQSLTLQGMEVELPLLPVLVELNVDVPQITAGWPQMSETDNEDLIEVEDISGYKAAWGLSSRVKGAHTVRQQA